jgi:tRNA(Arg) A34 adenosine deaminase TadA
MKEKMDHLAFLELAVEEARDGMRAGDGGPFGALIVRDGIILGKGHNTVLKSHDPSAHAEVNAIRNASAHMQDHHLTGATIYTNFEPCPMCLGAIYWADIREVYFCAGRQVAEHIGFMDKHLYEEFARPTEEREICTNLINTPKMDRLLDEWDQKDGKILY